MTDPLLRSIMDPLSITASVMTIMDVCFKATKTLTRIRDKFHVASWTLVAICSKAAIISASLAQLQNLLTDDVDIIVTRFETRPQILVACDTALTGCMMLFSCLEEEIRKFENVAAAQYGRLGWKDKARVAWKEDIMVTHLQHLNGQETALSLLLQLLQMYAFVDSFLQYIK